MAVFLSPAWSPAWCGFAFCPEAFGCMNFQCCALNPCLTSAPSGQVSHPPLTPGTSQHCPPADHPLHTWRLRLSLDPGPHLSFCLCSVLSGETGQGAINLIWGTCDWCQGPKILVFCLLPFRVHLGKMLELKAAPGLEAVTLVSPVHPKWGLATCAP